MSVLCINGHTKFSPEAIGHFQFNEYDGTYARIELPSASYPQSPHHGIGVTYIAIGR